MTIYVDLIFFENLILNYIILLATTIMRKLKIHWIKILFSSMLGSAFSILNYILEMNFLCNFLFKLVISFLMIIIAFENHKIIIFFKNLIIFYLISFTFGGASFMFLFFIKPQNIMFDSGHFIRNISNKNGVIGRIIWISVNFNCFKSN
ncbi:MAG: hypothetical protein HFJ45_08890 [Clostridia bacterium]|nr:hypothetical protein [Clostridia bacterium]